MKQNLSVSLLIGLFFIASYVMAGCSTTPIAGSKGSIIVTNIMVTPEVIAPGGYFLSSIEAYDTDGNGIFYSIASSGNMSLKDNNIMITQAPTTSGTQEIVFAFSNGRSDASVVKKIYVDDSVQSTVKTGTTTLPLGKSFDLLTGTIKDQYYGDLDFYKSYGDYYLTFSGSGSGASYSYFDGGIANLNVFTSAEEYSKILYPYYGYYLDTISNDYYYDEEKIIVNNNYAVWFMRGAKNYYAKIRILKYDDEGLTFDWLAQADPSKEKFYD